AGRVRPARDGDADADSRASRRFREWVGVRLGRGASRHRAGAPVRGREPGRAGPGRGPTRSEATLARARSGGGLSAGARAAGGAPRGWARPPPTASGRLGPARRAPALDRTPTKPDVKAQRGKLVFAGKGWGPFSLGGGSRDATRSALPATTLVPALEEERPRF